MPEAARSSGSQAARLTMYALGINAAVACASMVVLYLGMPIVIPAVFGAAFEPAVYPAQILLLGYAAYGLASILDEGLKGIGRPLLGAAANGAGALVTLVGVIWLAPLAGLSGAAAASTTGYVAALALLLVLFGRVRRSLTETRVMAHVWSATASTPTQRAVRILLYTPFFAPMVSGMATFPGRLAEGLAERGIHVVVVTDTAAAEVDRAAPLRGGSSTVVAAASQLVRWADIVHFSGFDFPLFVLAKACRRPTIWTHHDYGPPVCWRPGSITESLRDIGPDARCGPFHLAICWREFREGGSFAGALTAYLRLWVHILARPFVEANVVMLNSHQTACNLRGARVIPHWIPSLAESSGRSDGSPLASRPTVVFAGRHAASKGGAVLLRAVARLLPDSAEWRVVLAGDGSERAAWMALAARLGVAAEYPGALSWEATQLLLRRADVVVVPTVSSEYFGLAALEAMAQGAYVIASGIGGLEEIIDRCGGATFPPGDDEALAARLRDALADRQGARLRGRVAQQRAARQFSEDGSIRAYAALYDACRLTRGRGSVTFAPPVRALAGGR